MKEISENIIYELLQDKYDRVGLDYVILSCDEEYKGIETHKEAVIDAFEILSNRYSSYEINADKMNAEKISADDFLELPSDDYSAGKKSFIEKKKTNWNYTIPAPIPYWFAFLEPPYSTPYLESDFIEFNDVLIPDKNNIEIYRWNDDFSDYFDAGKEWWGTGLWSIYDTETCAFIIIGASLTD